MENQDIPLTSLDNCLNCNHALKPTDAFCAACGQRTRESRISSWQLISEFFRSIFNIDSKFFRSIGLLFFPSRLTKEYIQGKRRSFINPSRFFFVSLLIHFGMLALLTKNEFSIELGNDDIISEIREDIDHAELQTAFDTLLVEYPLINAQDADSLKLKLLGKSIDIEQDSITDFIFQVGSKSFGNSFTSADLIHLTSDEFTDKYGKDSFWNRIVVRQVYRFLHEPRGAVQFLIGNFLWVIVLLALFTAFFLKVLYIRRKYFLVDHLTLSLFTHSFLLLTLSLYYIIEFFITGGDGTNSVFGIIALVVIPLYAFLSMKRYYKQGWLKTFLKFILLSFYQLTIVGIFVLLVAMVSLLIY